jgi:hypothetical protein
MDILKKIFSVCALMILMAVSVMAQDTLSRSVTPVGGRWTSSGNLTSFTTVGQMGAATHLIGESDGWTGSVGFLTQFLQSNNNPPVAVAASLSVLVDLDSRIVLEGFDPDGDSIRFEVVSQPANGTVELVPGTLNEFEFVPATGLKPDVLYKDSLVFQVMEVQGNLVSKTAKFRFRFSIEDSGHAIDSAYFSKPNAENGVLTLKWSDPVINDAYGVVVSYYDLSNLSNPIFRDLYDDQTLTSGLVVDGSSVSFDLGVSAATHPYIFTGSKVFATALVTTANGNSDFFTFVIDNSAGSRVAASDDGLFFAFGSNMTVRENGTVNLELVAVELGEFALANASIEILKSSLNGTIGTPKVKSTKVNTKSWELAYTGTREVGGKDSVQFRVFNPGRLVYDTAWARIQIKDVNDPPKMTRLPDFQTDEEVSLTINLAYTDPDNEVDVFVESNETTKVPVSYSNGVITVSPGLDYSGKVSVNVVLTEIGTDEQYVAFDRFDVSVKAINDAPVVAFVANQTIDEDKSLTLVLSATDVDAKLPVFDFSASVDQPSKVDISFNGNNVTIAPKPNVFGNFEISLFADDRLGTPTSKSVARKFLLTVNEVNDAPSILKSFKTQQLISGFPAYVIDLKAYFTDIENAASLQYSASGNTNVNLTFNGANMTVDGGASFTGVEEVMLTASDGELSVSQQITFVRVQESSNIVVANPPGIVQLDEDFGTSTFDASGVFTDQNNASAVFTFSLLGGGFVDATIDENTGLITLVSPMDYSGSEKLFLVGTTNDQSKFVELNLQINPVNDAPMVQAMAVQVMQEDIRLSNVFIEVSDVDNDFSSLQISATSSLQSLIKDANVTFAPGVGGFFMDIDPEPDQFGEATITLIVNDGEASVTRQFGINVQAVNDAPDVLVNSLSAINQDMGFSIDLDTLFSDKENDVLEITVTDYPTWATFENKMIFGTPKNEDVGNWRITLIADDGNGGSNSVILSLQVLNVNDAPELIGDLVDLTVFQENAWSYTFPVRAFRDIDAGEVLTYSFESYPSWATLTGSTLSGTPQYEDIGSQELVMKVTDAAGLSISKTVNVNVEFTVYDAQVSAVQNCNQTEGKLEISASGAVDYIWYNSDEERIQDGGAVLSVSGSLDPVYYVEGVDSNGNATPEKVMVSVECVLLSVADLSPKVEVFPNPTFDKLTISGSFDALAFDVFDIMGKRVNLKIINEEKGKVELDVSGLSSGVFLINYKIGEQTKIIRFIKN